MTTITQGGPSGPPVPFQPPRAKPCRLAFVGEAPGKDEEARGGLYLQIARGLWPDAPWTWRNYQDGKMAARRLPRLPLVGSAGRVFNAAVRAAGVDRNECWVGNVFEHKAPGNNVEPWLKDEAIYGPAFERLALELQDAQPTVIVPMGGSALQAFTGMSSISKMRGGPSEATRIVPGAKLLPTFHPSFVQRVWKQFPTLIGDFIRADQEATIGPKIRFPHREFLIEPKLVDLRVWADRCDQSDLLSVDIETGWGQITSIAFAPVEEEALVVPFLDLRTSTKGYWPSIEHEAKAWWWVQERLAHPSPKVGQNFPYDAYWLLDDMGFRTYNYLHDTRLMHHALYPELPKSLAAIATYGSQPPWKHWSERRSDKRDDD